VNIFIKNIEPVISYYPGFLAERFKDHFAQISTDTLLRLKSSIKDVHRVIDGAVSPEIEIICKKLPIPPQGILDHDFVFGYKGTDGTLVPGIIESNTVLIEYAKKYPKHWEIVQRALGCVRQKSVHACAVVLTNEPITSLIPTTSIGSCKNPVTQYTANWVEEIGGLKYDFLGVNSLNDIQKAIDLIQKRRGYLPKDEIIDGVRVPGLRVVPFQDALYDIWALPEHLEVFDDICSGKTETVFQFNTGSAKQWLKEFYVDSTPVLKSICDLGVFTALDRPGPLDAFVEEGGLRRNMLQEFASRAKGENPIGANEYLNKFFPETYGVIVFQEQLTKVFQILGNTTPEQADEFRVHVGKKKMSEVVKDRDIFLAGASPKLGTEEAERIWGMLLTFAQYGFNKSHAIAYVVISFACAFLKHYFPLEWWCAVLQNATRKEIDEDFWMHCGKLVLPPDIRLSKNIFTIEGDKIRAPISLLNGVGPKAHNELSALTFNNIEELCQKIYDKRVKEGQTITEEVVDKKGITKTQTKIKLASTALGNALLSKLIITGVADSLFPTECADLYSKLALFYTTKARIEKKRASPIDASLLETTPLQRFLLKKEIFPFYSENLMRLVAEKLGIEKMTPKGEYYEYVLKREFNGDDYCPIVPGKVCKAILDSKNNSTLNLPPKFMFGVVAYISAVEWFWNNKAARVSFSVDEERFTVVRWANKKEKDKNFGPLLPKNIEKSIAVITLCRWDIGKDFSVDQTQIVEAGQ
jgi:hypothetical protein